MDDDRRHGERRVSMARQFQIGSVDDQALRIIIGIVDEYIRNWGRLPTPEQLRAELRGRSG